MTIMGGNKKLIEPKSTFGHPPGLYVLFFTELSLTEGVFRAEQDEKEINMIKKKNFFIPLICRKL